MIHELLILSMILVPIAEITWMANGFIIFLKFNTYLYFQVHSTDKIVK